MVGFNVFLKKLSGAQKGVTSCAGNLISFRLQQLASSRVVWVDINGFGWHWALDFEQTFDVVEDQCLLPQVRDILVLPVADQALPHVNLSSSDAPHLVDHVQLDLVRDEQLLLKRNHFKVLELAQPTWDWTQFETPVKVKGIWPLWPCGHSCIEREEPQKVKVFLQKNLGRPFLLLDLSRCKDVKWRVGLTKKKKMKKKRTVDGFLLQCSGWLLARPPSKGSRRLNAIIQLTHSDQNFCNSTPRSTSRGPKGSQPVTGDQRVRLINHWNQA